MKRATGGVARGLRRDGTAKTELRVRKQGFRLSAFGGRAEIHVLMPLRDAERNALVEIIFGKTFRCGIHDADEGVTVTVFLVKQRRRMLRVEGEEGFAPVSVVREVVHVLRDVGQEDLKALVERDVIVLVLL